MQVVIAVGFPIMGYYVIRIDHSLAGLGKQMTDALRMIDRNKTDIEWLKRPEES